MDKPSSYILEIYEPDRTSLHSRFQQQIPFPRISKGDQLQLSPLYTNEVVEVKTVEHAVWETEKVFTFQTLIWTTEIKK